MIFLFPRWDMLIPWRVDFFNWRPTSNQPKARSRNMEWGKCRRKLPGSGSLGILWVDSKGTFFSNQQCWLLRLFLDTKIASRPFVLHIQSRRFSNINLYLAVLLSSYFTISKKTNLSHSRKGGTVHSPVTWGAKTQTSTQLFLRKRLIKPPPGLPQIHDGVPKQNGQNPCCLLVKRLESAAFFSLRSIRRNRWPQSFSR